MELRIYDKSGNLRAEVCPDDNSTQQKAVMGDNALSVSFTTWEAIPFDIGDYVDYEGERYTLLTVPCPNQASTLEYEYAPRFQGIESELSKALCFLLTDGDMDSDFSLTDGPAAHLRLIVDNINRVKGTTDWRIGSVIAADYKVVTYDGIDCLTALNRIAETFETEWWIVGTTLYLGKCEHGEPLVLGYAADGTAVGGLLGMSRRDEENERFFTRLYAKGSTRNIDRSRYGSDRLRLPSPLRFLERNTEYGIVQRALLGIRYGIVDQDFIDNMGEETGIKELGGAYVSSVVEGGSASEAGIRKGDVILDIDGVKINDNATLSEQIGRRRPNDKVKLSVKRDGKVKQIDVTLRNKAGKTELITKEDVDMVEVLGGKFADAGAKLCRELDIKGGVQVVGIKADGILARARVKQGFVITHINDRPVYSLSDMERMTDKVRSIDGIYPNGRAASYVLVE